MKKNGYTAHITLWIFLGLILGIAAGFILPASWTWASQTMGLLSTIYMSALRMMIFPLVFCSLVMGIQGIGSVSKTGKIGLQTILYFTGTLCSHLCWVCSCPKLWAWARALRSPWTPTIPTAQPSSPACWTP